MNEPAPPGSERDEGLDSLGLDAGGPASDFAAKLAIEFAQRRLRARLLGEAPTPVRVDRFVVEHQLGAGGMGTVWRAHDEQLERTVALKFIRADQGNPGMRHRLVQEAQGLARISHPNVARIYDVGSLDDGTPYLVMEYLEGSDLRQLLERCGPLPTGHAARLLIQACAGIAEAHAAGIVHRDLKLDNLFLTHLRSGAPCVKVLDFGISKDTRLDVSLTRSGVMMGSPRYMSPEQLRDAKQVDGRADVWALGVILYELLSGAPPFGGESFAEVISAVMTSEPVPLRARRPELGAALESVVSRCLVKQVDARFASVELVAAALAGFAGDEPWPSHYRGAGEPARSGEERVAATEPEPERAPATAPATEPGSARTSDRTVGPVLAGALELPSGPVLAGSPFYVAKPELEDRCRRAVTERGALLRIKGAQQTGKTSLMTRILDYARSQGARVVSIDLQLVDAKISSSLERFLQWLCAIITRRLGQRWSAEGWDDIFGPKDNCTDYFEQHLLGDPERDEAPLVLALEHLDRLFDSPNIAKEFLILLRAWHELSKAPGRWSQLRLVLAYSTEMYLPLDVNHSPFNVGLAVPLGDWSRETIADLAGRHGLSWGARELDGVTQLLGGHPHLVRVLLYHLAEGERSLDAVLAEAPSEKGLFADHLKQLLWRLQKQPALGEAAVALMAADGPLMLDSELAFKLVSLGVARLQGDGVVVGRELYRRYLSAHLPELHHPRPATP